MRFNGAPCSGNKPQGAGNTLIRAGSFAGPFLPANAFCVTLSGPQLRSASNFYTILFDLDSVERSALQIADASQKTD
jgi:hypothetical protein